jgi:hypothetical protein
MKQIEPLNAFVGRWTTRGRIHDGDRSFSGTDTYEWLAGQHFLIHRVDVRMGGREMKAIEIIGWDAERDTYVMNSFDSQGAHTVMQASVSEGAWRFEGETMRFHGAFSADGRTISGTWETRGDDEAWRPWMDVVLTKKDG